MAIRSVRVEKDFENKLLRRRELRILLEYKGGTPSREEIKARVASELGANHEYTVVVDAQQLYGAGKTRVLVHQYEDKEAMKMEQKHIFARPNKKKEKKPAAAQKEGTAQGEEKGEAKAE